MTSFRCQALLFDLDGVLVDSTASVERTWREWAERHGLDAARVLAIAHGRRTRETLQLVAPHLDLTAELDALAAAELMDVQGTQPLPGAVALFGSVPPDRCAVVTSGSRSVAEGRLRHAGLAVPAVLVTADDVARGKPHPEGYRSAAARLGVSADACLVIEDAPPGLAAAWAAEMRVLAVLGTHTAEQLAAATALVESLVDVDVQLDGVEIVVSVNEATDASAAARLAADGPAEDPDEKARPSLGDQA